MKILIYLLKKLVDVQSQQLQAILSFIGSYERPEYEEEEFIGTKDVMQMVNRSARTLDNWIQRKILVPVKINGTNHFRKSDVLELLHKGRNGRQGS